ncbi:hypothetical protein FSP39_012187 [Pinctada imbricata]|uniref:VWFA domain-containing protein n=1 Tax=Pinctada imbricata TaxID=66713 RepID=A0AA89C0M1_PINIB|nr:hypothetical protein FSP39_012187 [Pinctada imbricata]
MESKTEDSDGKKTSIVNLSGSDVQNGSQQSSDKSKETDSNESDQSVPIARHSPIPGVSIKEEEKLHFCIRQDNTYVQIGQCCVIVELSVNDELVEKLKREGQLTAEVRSGQTLVTLQWRDLTEEKDYYLSKLKLIVKEKQREIQADLDAELVRSLTEEQCHNVRKIVHKIFSDIQGRLIEISEGCVVLTFHHLTLESYKKLHEMTYAKHLEEYFTAELITDRMKEISADARISVRLVSNGESANRLIEPLYTTSRQSIQDSSYIADLARNISQLQMEISDIRGNLHSELSSFKQENSVQMTNVRDSVSEVREDLSRRLRESADALRGEIKEVIGQQSEEISLLRQQYSKTEEKETQFEQQLASRLADILLPRFQQLLSSASSSSQTTTAELPPVPASMDRHERLSREFQTSLTTPSPEPSSGRSAPSTLDVAVASSLRTTSSLQTAPSPEKSLSDRKYEYFLKTLRKSSELYEYQSSMDDDEALRRALFASKQKSDEKTEQKPTAKPGSDDTLVGWLKHNTTNDVLDCIRNSLDIAKQDSSKNQSPRASKAIATVLLLDTSESMRESQGLDEMKSLVQRFIDKTKEMGLKSGDYKENVGLVTFGSTARIIQHLTSDFSSTNHLIDKLEADGQQTSLLEGILVAISAISGKGVNLKFGPYHKVLPRIIIISDGLVTDYSQVKSDIIKGVDDQVCWRSPDAKHSINVYRYGAQGQSDIKPLWSTMPTQFEGIG